MKHGVFVSDYELVNDTLDRVGPDGLILVANGVYHASIKGSPLLDKYSILYALSEDLETRGIDPSTVDSKVKVVDYSGLVDVIFNDFEKIAWL
jgi:sulfur relay protein TusB/DsrH